MTIEEASIQLFRAVLAAPQGQQMIDSGHLIIADDFFRIPSVAKELFNQEPGCAVRYDAIDEKIKLLEPHLRVTPSGPNLMTFFSQLLNQRKTWAMAMARYQANIFMTFLANQKKAEQNTNPIEAHILSNGSAEEELKDRADAAEQKLSETKCSREFCRYVRILEECARRHKMHLQRRANAEKTRRKTTLLKKRKQNEQSQRHIVTMAKPEDALAPPSHTALFEAFDSSIERQRLEVTQDRACCTNPVNYIASNPPTIFGSSTVSAQYTTSSTITASDATGPGYSWRDFASPETSGGLYSCATPVNDLSAVVEANHFTVLPILEPTYGSSTPSTQVSTQPDLDSHFGTPDSLDFLNCPTEYTDLTAQLTTNHDPDHNGECKGIANLVHSQETRPSDQPELPSEWLEPSDNDIFPAFDPDNLGPFGGLNDFGAGFDDEFWGNQIT